MELIENAVVGCVCNLMRNVSCSFVSELPLLTTRYSSRPARWAVHHLLENSLRSEKNSRKQINVVWQNRFRSFSWNVFLGRIRQLLPSGLGSSLSGNLFTSRVITNTGKARGACGCCLFSVIKINPLDRTLGNYLKKLLQNYLFFLTSQKSDIYMTSFSV